MSLKHENAITCRLTVANINYRPTLSSLCILLFKQRLHKFNIGYSSLLPASVRRPKLYTREFTSQLDMLLQRVQDNRLTRHTKWSQAKAPTTRGIHVASENRRVETNTTGTNPGIHRWARRSVTYQLVFG